MFFSVVENVGNIQFILINRQSKADNIHTHIHRTNFKCRIKIFMCKHFKMKYHTFI